MIIITVEVDKTNKRRNEISFRRFGDLYNATKRTNDILKFHLVVCSFCRVVVDLEVVFGVMERLKHNSLLNPWQ